MEVLPVWVQCVVALATVLSSVGVIIAIVQLRVSSNQFHQQLKLTTQQFRLINQGYLNFFLTQMYVPADISENTKDNFQDPDTEYQSITLNGTFENVGNVPVKLLVKSFQILINGNVVSDSADDTVPAVENIVFPKQRLPYFLGRIRVNDGKTNFTVHNMVSQKVTYKIIATYHDYNSENIKKTLKRSLELTGLDLQVTHFDDILGEA